MPDQHDKLFKVTFNQPQQAVRYFKSFLPEPIVNSLDFDRAELQLGSFIDEHLRYRHSDVLYQIPLHSPEAEAEAQDECQHLLLYILFEAQGTIDYLMPFRVLRYMVRIWEDVLEKAPPPKPKTLPVILPLVLYHGEGKWTAATSFFDLMQLPAALADDLRPYIPQFEFLLDELPLPLKKTALLRGMVRVTLFLLKQSRLANLAELLTEIIEDLQITMEEDTNDLKNSRQILEYIMRTGNISQEALKQMITKIGPKAQELAMTVAEQLHNEGLEKGRKEGLEKGRKEGQHEALVNVLLGLIEARFGSPRPDIVETLRSASSERLEALTKRILVAQSIQDLLNDGN